MTCEVCLALEFASEDSLRSLVVYQARQLDRILGGWELEDLDAEDDEPEAAPAPPPPDVVSVVEAVLWHDDIHRKPPRVAAPRLIDRLADAGIHLTREDLE